MEKIRKTAQSKRILYILLFVLCFVPELIFLTRHGFYWDDWSQMLVHVKFDDQTFWNYFSYDRPGSAWTHVLYFPICGISPVKWHLLFLTLKYILTILFWKIFRIMFPENSFFTDTAAIFFAACPLFSQGYISIAYSQHYTDFVLFAFSVYTLNRAALSADKSKRILWFILSTLSMIAHLSVTEYFAFLEVLKLPILYMCFINNNEKEKPAKSFLWFAPHFLIFLTYCIFRLNYSKYFPNFSANTPDLLFLLKDSPLEGIKALSENMAADLSYLFTGFISRLFDFNNLQILSTRELSLILFSALLSYLFFVFYKRSENDIRITGKQSVLIFLLCLAGMIFAIFPFWVMNQNFLNNGDQPHADRCFMAAMPFFSLASALILILFFPDKSKRIGNIAVMAVVFLFVHYQMSIYLDASDLTKSQNAFYHQLSERIPGLEDGTAIVDDTIIFPEQGNFATATAINILYPNPVRENGHLPVWVFSYDTRMYENHGGFHVQKRNYQFNQPPSDYIYIDHDNKFANCLWVFGPEDVDNPHVTDLQRSWIKNSAINRIKTENIYTVNEQIFGKKNSGWCNYYEEASLLRQKEDWESLSELTHKVLSEGFTPSTNSSNAPFEWWPFIEGLMRSGEKQLGLELSAEAINTDPAYRLFFENRLSEFN